MTTGLVVARFRNTAEVERDGQRYKCQLKGKRMNVVVGDRVQWQTDAAGALITEVLTRQNALTRVSNTGRPEVLAANIDHLVVVVSPKPAADWFLVDRYLCAAELMGLAVTIVLNKTDLDTAEEPAYLDAYRSIGYQAITTSAQRGDGLQVLKAGLASRRSVLVGQSGVGKSSLLNALIPTAAERVAALSERSQQGRHTTSTAVLHPLPGGGELIDSPGVRDYAPFISDVTEVAGGFREFSQYAAHCRFANCRHLEEPDCAVKTAVTAGDILKRRYESFLRLTALTRELHAH